mmetsp:Transcript_17525/g.17608  ORF Transcript_17525/g.17608 Transcript_17525/m.17608 type:complete len:530 (+) Transcript_17525:113-1702(+)|eukprot:CAMPEP_0182429378 /NCGR_PEP_ID=MMETSP1167-20130531/27464_1 /TAXON_ID=2988 /ORGANISM="Mallomonas Sp, Strain CCMP3275" /LENGTH=529 /DNA_ID=CAMNT_0024612961 /DNA_START=113 /DNA_END=1702 /DNA_ORIENTATION=+
MSGNDDEIKSTSSITSKQTTSPFPFAVERPEMPHVDSYIDKDYLKTCNLQKYAKKKRLHPIVPTALHTLRTSSQIDIEEEDDDMVIQKLDYDDDTKGVIKFIRSCGDKNSDYITLKHLERAFRKCKRNPHLGDGSGNDIQYLMMELEQYIRMMNTTPHHWFKSIIKSHDGHYNKTATWKEFKYAVRTLCRQVDEVTWPDESILKVLHFLDSNHNGYIAIADFEEAFSQVDEMDSHSAVLTGASAFMLHILDIIRHKQMRIRDLFRSLDPRFHDKVSIEALAKGLHQMFSDETCSQTSQSSSRTSHSALNLSQLNEEMKLPFIGGTICTNKMLLERLVDTHHKLETSKVLSDPQVLSPQLSCRVRARSTKNTILKPVFEVEERQLEKQPPYNKFSKFNSLGRRGLVDMSTSSSISVSETYSDDDEDSDAFSVHSRSGFGSYGSHPFEKRNTLDTLSLEEGSSSVGLNMCNQSLSNLTTSALPLRKVNTVRSLRQRASLRAQVKAEAKGYDAFIDQFDKKVELYLKRLDRI